MAILVTGGGGFIGSHVVRHLIEAGESVRVLHLPGEDLRNLQGLNAELIPGNVLDKATVEQAVKGCDRVCHLAAVYAFWMPDPKKMFEVNIEGSRNVLEACVRQKVKKVVYTSSVTVFGGQGPGVSATEESPFRIGTTGELYSITKYQSHQLAEKFAADGLDVTIVCPTLPLGPGDIGPTPTGKYIVDAAASPVIFYTDTTTNVGDVRDIARGHLLAMEKGRAGRSYILGGDTNYSMREFMEAVNGLLPWRRPMIKVSHNFFKALGYVLEMRSEFFTRKAPALTSQSARASALGLSADISRAKQELGYTCRPMEESLRDAFDWFREMGYVG